jgi:hypothetical protein
VAASYLQRYCYVYGATMTSLLPALPEPDWSSDQQTYIGWLALPRRGRFPKTEAALASDLSVDRSTLYRWRRLPGFMKEVRTRIMEQLGERYADVLAKIESQAVAGSIQHQRLYLEMLGAGVTADEQAGPNIKVLVGVDLALVGAATVVVPRE